MRSEFTKKFAEFLDDHLKFTEWILNSFYILTNWKVENADLYGNVVSIRQYLIIIYPNLFDNQVQKSETLTNISWQESDIFLRSNSQIMQSRQRILW